MSARKLSNLSLVITKTIFCIKICFLSFPLYSNESLFSFTGTSCQELQWKKCHRAAISTQRSVGEQMPDADIPKPPPLRLLVRVKLCPMLPSHRRHPNTATPAPPPLRPLQRAGERQVVLDAARQCHPLRLR